MLKAPHDLLHKVVVRENHAGCVAVRTPLVTLDGSLFPKMLLLGVPLGACMGVSLDYPTF